MDLVGACRVFVHVSERGSFTLGAAAAGVRQPVASRRVAALEERLGAPLFDRAARRAQLTVFGRDLLPTARRLVALADDLGEEAERALRRPVTLAVPDVCTTLDLAHLDAEARGHGLHLDLRPVARAERRSLLNAHQVRLALETVPADEATWVVPLGLAGTHPPHTRGVRLESLRVGREHIEDPGRRVWITPEDDVPHVRDRLARVRDAVGLRPGQVALIPTVAGALTEVLTRDDLLLCSPHQARELSLDWLPVRDAVLERGYVLAGADDDAGARVRDRLTGALGRCLGARSEEGGDDA